MTGSTGPTVGAGARERRGGDRNPDSFWSWFVHREPKAEKEKNLEKKKVHGCELFGKLKGSFRWLRAFKEEGASREAWVGVHSGSAALAGFRHRGRLQRRGGLLRLPVRLLDRWIYADVFPSRVEFNLKN